MLDSALKVSVIIGSALAASGLLRTRSAALRHWVLAAAIGCAVVVPALEWLVPAWGVAVSRTAPSVPASRFTSSPASAAPLSSEISATPPVSAYARASAEESGTPAVVAVRWFAALWILGAGGTLAVLLVGLCRLARLARTARPLSSRRWQAAAETIALEYGVRQPIRLLAGESPTLLVTWGYRRPIVLVPAAAVDWPDDRVRVVLSHELAHIQRHDWLMSIVGEVLRAIHWFNPLVWIACRWLRLESERACDDVVLRRGVDGPAYASHLLDVARSFGRYRRAWLPAPAMVRASSLERRIDAMLTPGLNRRPLTSAARTVTLAVAVALTASVAGFGAAQTFGSAAGTVVDTTNRPIAGATLVLTGSPNQAKHELRSDATGHFEFVGLPLGEYRLEVKSLGFATYRADILVGARPVQQMVTLQVGNLMETITVSGVRTGPQRELVEPVLPDTTGCVASGAGGNILPPVKLRDFKPAYPAGLYEAGVEGHVVLDARIGTNGAPRELRVVSPVNPDFDAAALEAVRQWRFSQTLLNCVPVEVSMTVNVNFVPRL